MKEESSMNNNMQEEEKIDLIKNILFGHEKKNYDNEISNLKDGLSKSNNLHQESLKSSQELVITLLQNKEADLRSEYTNSITLMKQEYDKHLSLMKEEHLDAVQVLNDKLNQVQTNMTQDYISKENLSKKLNAMAGDLLK